VDLRCTTDDYDRLYARWLTKPGALLDAADYRPGQVVLDLCGGTGAVSLECLRRGADPKSITLLDLNPRCPDDRITQLKGDATSLGDVFGDDQPDCHGRYDLIICRQAAAYLSWHLFMLNWLYGLMPIGGKLVFNTFVRPRWSLKTYRHEGRRFIEASAHFRRRVFHLQAADGLGYDVTKFRWHDAKVLEVDLQRWFKVSIETRGRSQTWTCLKVPKRELRR
jgi:SAM-dependent methyltransferase